MFCHSCKIGPFLLVHSHVLVILETNYINIQILFENSAFGTLLTLQCRSLYLPVTISCIFYDIAKFLLLWLSQKFKDSNFDTFFSLLNNISTNTAKYFVHLCHL